jgi:uncharacterized lipoprotein YajG
MIRVYQLLIKGGIDLKSKIAVLGILSVLVLVVFVSGCTSNEKILYGYNLTSGQAPNYIGVQNVTIPNGTKTIKVEAQNLTKLYNNLSTSTVNIYALSTVPVTVAATNNDTAIIKNYNASVVLQKTIDLSNETSPKSFNYTFNDTSIKGFLVINVNSQGFIQFSVT